MNTTTILLLGILLASPVAAEFCDGNFVVEAGNWSDIEIHDGGTVTRETYNWRDSKSTRWNRGRMNDPTRFDMPKGTVLHTSSSGYISWIAVYDVQYTYTVQYNGHTYTNNTSSMSYKAAWLERPCRHYSDMNRYVDTVTVEPVSDGIKFCVWQHWTDSDRDKHPSYSEKTIPAGIDDVRQWTAPNTEATAMTTDATMGCCLLEIETPPGILGYRIDAVSANHSAFYERNFGMMQRNTTESGKEFFEIIKATTEHGEGMSTFGQSKYLLPNGDYTISMIVYTPFEKIPVNITMTTEAEELPEIDMKGALKSLISLLTLTTGMYFMLRGL